MCHEDIQDRGAGVEGGVLSGGPGGNCLADGDHPGLSLHGALPLRRHLRVYDLQVAVETTNLGGINAAWQGAGCDQTST